MIMVATIMRIVVIIDFDDGENNAEGDGNSDGDDDDAFGEDDDIGDDDGRCERVFPGPDTVPTAV